MSLIKRIHFLFFFLSSICLGANNQATVTSTYISPALSPETIAAYLGWINQASNRCGGYYLDQPFVYSIKIDNPRLVEITSNQGFISQRGTSFLEEHVTLTREGQQTIANKAFIYRDPQTNKLAYIDLLGDVHLREPNTLIIANKGYYDLKSKHKSLYDVIYRTKFIGQKIAGHDEVSTEAQKKAREVTGLNGWGMAKKFVQNEPRVYQLSQATFSTCPANALAWQLKASHITINKNTGRGEATHARLYVKNILVLYSPYLNFSVSKKRKTGFLTPTVGGSNRWGPYMLLPFYWNMAPNYDMTLTTGFLSKNGLLFSDRFRYLTQNRHGFINAAIVPYDFFFNQFKRSQEKKFANSGSPPLNAQLNRLLNSSNFRKAFLWRDDWRPDEHWLTHIDFNYAGDDYYYRDYGSDLNQVIQNQLLQEAEVAYKGENWNFIGRLQGYQTLHPIDEGPVLNQYRRFPQLVLNGVFPEQPFGLEYFIQNEAVQFDILKNPGYPAFQPIGSRFHSQLGALLPLNWPYFYINPRFQLALTHYSLSQVEDPHIPMSINRSIPIFDMASGLSLERYGQFGSFQYQQTLEPQIYYTYIPYRDQSMIPIFDTTVNTLTYDQIFNYNRFTSIDRIGDANQMGVGIVSRWLDNDTRLEKMSVGAGQIIYFANRLVTLSNSPTISDNPQNHSNFERLSPLSTFANFNLITNWTSSATALWNPVTKQLSNSTVAVVYTRDPSRHISFTFTYARNGDVLSGISTNDSRNNLKVTDISTAWAINDQITLLAKWSQNWNQLHLQNLIYGLEYDTCCWAVRAAGGRAYLGLDPTNNNKPQYVNQFYIQFALKGLGNIGSGDPTTMLSAIGTYNTNFG